jgi:hypothetical protein
MRPGTFGWWRAKLRQVVRHMNARVDLSERAALNGWLGPGQLALFDRMHLADRRHGLDVVATLRSEGVTDPDLLVAGLLHDAGKGDAGLVPRVVHSLGQAYGGWVGAAVAWLPGMQRNLDRLARHPELSAELAAAAGCSPRAVELIRWQEAPRDADLGRRLLLADERN